TTTNQNTTTTQTAQKQMFDIRLFDKHGNVVRQTKASSGKVEFDVSRLSEGTYFLHIEGNGKLHKEQIIVEQKGKW
ncbi:MAG: T9SS type A sorting domain-containing protein, partial [Bacteroidales bacterium]|nr:T9SS type A sorting domain-containing protein [Bacteroidales bacterium]